MSQELKKPCFVRFRANFGDWRPKPLLREKIEKIRRDKTQWSACPCPSVNRLVSPLAGRSVISVGCDQWRLVKNFRLQKVKSETSWHH